MNDEYDEYQIVIVGGPSGGTVMAVSHPIREMTIPTITKEGWVDEIYDLVGQTPRGRFIYEHWEIIEQ